MVRPFHYWTMPGLDGRRENWREFPIAKSFFQEQFPDPNRYSERELDDRLWHCWQAAIAQENAELSQSAELSLRCRVTHLCDQSIRILIGRFDLHEQGVNRDDLFGRLDYDDGSPTPTYRPLSLQILQDYKSQRQGKVNLVSLVKRKIRQHPELQKFLLEHEVVLQRDWALLNRASLQLLTTVERQIVQVFRAIYLRDRRQQQGYRYAGHNPDPTLEQFQEMCNQLTLLGIPLFEPTRLEQTLTQIAGYLRQEKIQRLKGYCSGDSLDVPQFEDDMPADPEDLQNPDPIVSVADREFYQQCQQWNLPQFCQQQLIGSLEWAITRAIRDRITFLTNKPKRCHLASLVEPALWLLYAERLSATEIAIELELKGQPDVSLMLEPKKMVETIRDHTIEQMYAGVLAQAMQLGYATHPPDMDYCLSLVEPITAIVNRRFAIQALKELSTSKNRRMDSLLATRLKAYLRLKLGLIVTLLMSTSLRFEWMIIRQITLYLQRFEENNHD